jgi:hypothetical protein
MNLFLLELLRYVFLLLIYIFIYRVIVTMMKDISSAGHKPSAGWLYIVKSSYDKLPAGEKINFSTPFQIGKKSNNDLIIDDSYMSHNHAIIYSHKKEIWIKDLGSTNGTIVNEIQIKEPVKLNDNDRIDIAGVVLLEFKKT